jgi:hypothetical protein
VRHGSNKTRKINIETEFHLPSGQRIGVDNAKNCFENLTPEIPFLGEGARRHTGAGSINAVMYLSGCSYDAATARIAEIFGNESIQRAAIKKIDLEIDDKKKDLLAPVEGDWPELLARLKAMNIHADVANLAKSNSSIATNSEGHILFTKQVWDENGNQENSGTLVIDPQFPEVTVMETGEDDTFILIDASMSDRGELMDTRGNSTVICATPMEALAIKSQREHRNANVIAIGRNPGEITKKTLQFFAEAYPDKMFFEENLLDAGRKLAAWLSEQLGQVLKKIPLPVNFRSWIGFQIASRAEILPTKETPVVDPENVTDPGLPAIK